jgi:excisionase family DNA binding protein
VPEQDFSSFDEALNQLNLREEELKRLVSEGEIRAFREGDTMKLRRTDVEHLKTELMGGEVVELGEGRADVIFEDDFEDPGMATEELTAADTLIDEDLGVLDEIEDQPEEDDEDLPVEEQEPDSPLVLAASIGTLVLLLLAGPLLFATSSGHLSDMARSIADIFVEMDGGEGQ